MRRILVTGSAGFLGRHLCRLIVERGDEALGLDLALADGAGREEIQGSVTDDALWQGLHAVDAVIHGAALTSLWRRDRSDFERVNRGGAERAAAFCASRDVPLVLVSSYTALMTRTITSETLLTGDEPAPVSQLVGAYPQSKRAAELSAMALHPGTVIVQPSAPIGPGDYTLTPPMKLLHGVAAGTLPGVMRGRINVVDIRDVAAATLTALDQGRVGERYLLSGTDLTLKDFAAAVAGHAGTKPPAIEAPALLARLTALAETKLGDLTGREPQATPEGVALAAMPVRFDNRRAKDALGFDPRSLDMSIQEALAFLRQAGLLPEA